jgi:outer membrane protein OmpA-like peptidoglycan-associated protein
LPSIAKSGPTGAIGEAVDRFLSLVFGAQQGEVASLISQRSGLSKESSVSVLRMAVPLVFAYLARMHNEGTRIESTLGSALKAQVMGLGSYLPPGFLKGSMGTVSGGTETAGDLVERPGRVGAITMTKSRSSVGWIVAGVIAGILLLAWLFFRSVPSGQSVKEAANNGANAAKVAGEAAVNATGQAATAVGNAATAAWASLGEPMKVTLAGGTEIHVPTNGVEARLAKYLEDGTAPVSQTTWFDFDRLLFDTDKATLQPASQEQLDAIAQILKAYPNAKIHIGGYTDNTGDSAANQQLSEERAQSVMAELTKLGIDPSRISAKGYGESNPIADNSTEEGRQRNRRTSIRVDQK